MAAYVQTGRRRNLPSFARPVRIKDPDPHKLLRHTLPTNLLTQTLYCPGITVTGIALAMTGD